MWNSHGREVKVGINNIAGSGTFARVGDREWGPAEPVTLLGSTGRPGSQSTSRTRGQETRTSPRTRRLQYSREAYEPSCLLRLYSAPLGPFGLFQI